MNVNRYTPFYWLGCYLIIIIAIGMQLIWLPAPYLSTTGKQWIEYINQLFYVIISIPLCWLIGGCCRLFILKRLPITVKIPQVTIVIGSLAIILFIAQGNINHIAPILICVIVILAIMIDVIYSVRLKQRLQRESKQCTRSRELQWLILYIGCIVLVLCPTAYTVTYPAMTMNMNRYAHIGEYSATGTIDGVLVFDRPAFPIDLIYEKLFPAYEIHRKAADAPSIFETYSEVVTMKEDTNKLAAAIALKEAGMADSISYEGVKILGVVANSPADGALQAGDIIISINDFSVQKMDELLLYMNEQVKPLEIVSLKVKRNDQVIPVSITTAAANDDAKRAVMGISIQTAYRTEVDLPLYFESYIAHVGGPSHGAMLTLSFLDQLTAGDITKGLYIAGTGTIEADGTVGMVGGIAQKAFSVSRTAADVFFVPAAGADIAKVAAPQLNVVAVYTISDIIEWLEAQTRQSS